MSERKQLTPTQIKHKKRVQAGVSQATGTLGLAALTGTALATKRGQKVLGAGFKRAGRKVPKRLQAKPANKDLRSSITPILATSAGLGSLGAFNFAAYTRAEGDKKVRKSDDSVVDIGIAKRYEEEMEDFISKKWEPVASKYDPEEKRDKRSRRAQTTAQIATIGAGTGAVGAAVAGMSRQGRVAQEKQKSVPNKAKVKRLRAGASRSGKLAGALTLTTIGAGAAEAGIRNRRKDSWATYSKSATSAFGVMHD